MPWHDSRPVFSRLPERGYRDNPIADALTSWVDEKLTAKADQLQSFYLQLDPSTASDEYLDYLAFLVGLSGSYWDTEWTPQVKRSLIAASHNYLWANRGTLGVIEFVLKTHGISYDIWQDGSSVLPFKLPKTFGANRLRFFVRLPLRYARTSSEWREAERVLKCYAPAVVQCKVYYQGFRMSFSRLGDAMF